MNGMIKIKERPEKPEKRPLFKESICSFLKARKVPIIIFTGIVAIFGILFCLYDIPSDAIIYGVRLSIVWSGVCFLIDFYKYYKRHKLLHISREQFFEDAEQLPEYMDVIEGDYQELAKELYQSKRELISENRTARKEMLDYYGMWVHQIKTPIAAMRLLLQEEDTPLSREMQSELFQTEQYVQMALQYLRMEKMTSDLVFARYDLDALIRQAVRKYAPLFIRRKIILSYEPVHCEVLTDEKWLVFVLEQILSNALKYTKSGSIHIYLSPDAPKTLVIEDTGIGIAPEDLPRIFEKGYTGCNGRADKRSTGIGLYLCRQIMEKLSHTIRIESEMGVGTKVYLGLDTVSL